MEQIAIIGCSNVGKTTFFNHWLKCSSPTGNRAGVTVDAERKRKKIQRQFCHIIDTPGIRALTPAFYDQLPRDAQVTHDVIYQDSISHIINVVDGRQLERDVFLTTQLLELGLPIIMVINQFPLNQRPCDIMNRLSDRLGVPVIAGDCDDLDEQLCSWISAKDNPKGHCIPIAQLLSEDHCQSPKLTDINARDWLRWIQKDPHLQPTEVVSMQLATWQREKGDLDVWLIEKRMAFVAKVVGQSLPERQDSMAWDQWLTHPIIGFLIFLTVMFGVFYITVIFGGSLQETIYGTLKILLVNGLSQVFMPWVPEIIMQWLFHGAISGLIMMVSFLPLMWLLNFMQHALEETGYWPRAVFLVDRWMNKMGLHGQSFIPLMLGFGCNVPAVAATRTMTYQKDRILTAMMVPFMSCSARLMLYVVFSVVFFPKQAYYVIAFLYLLGVFVAMLTGLIMNQFVFQQDRSPLLQVLPPLQMPSFKVSCRVAWVKSSRFVYRACKTVVPVCVALVILTQIPIQGSSLLVILGKTLSYLFVPLGLGPESWPIGVALVIGVLAKEAIIGVLATLVAGQMLFQFDVSPLWQQMQNLGNDPVLSNAVIDFFPASPYASVLAFLVFALLYYPCITTFVVMKRELGKRWAWASVFWSLMVGYIISSLTYCLFSGDFTMIPWVLSGAVLVLMILWRRYGYQNT